MHRYKVKKSLYFLVLIGIALSIFWCFQTKKPVRKFSCIDLSNIGVGNIPCFEVDIEKKTFEFGLDLGLDADLSGKKELIQQIADKSLEKTVCMSGVRGRRYQESVYRIPDIKLEGVTFRRPLINEQHSTWEAETTFDPIEKDDRLNPIGLIGWRLFRNLVVFLNFKDSYIALAGSIEDLKNEESIEEAVRVPLHLDHGFLEIDIQLCHRTCTCILDTGFTRNILNNHEVGFVTIEEFRIGEKQWEQTRFLQKSMNFPTQVDVILGMEFFLNHPVVIDFQKREVFFLP